MVKKDPAGKRGRKTSKPSSPSSPASPSSKPAPASDSAPSVSTDPCQAPASGKPRHHPTDEDLNALDDFCSGIHLDEIPMATWESCLDALDLTVPLFVSADEARLGSEKTVNFCRTVKADQRDKGTRRPASCQITLPPGVRDGETLVLEAEGDRLGETTGDLRVIIRVTSRS